MVDKSDTFLREVDEEMRREQLLKIWNNYGIFIVAAVVLMFGGIGGYKYMESSRMAAAEANGARFEQAIHPQPDAAADEATKILDQLAKTAAPGYQTLARLRIAAADQKAGKSTEALAAYEAVSKDAAADRLLQEFAGLQAAMLRVDSADWTEMQNRLTPLTSDISPWRSMAREVLALAAMKAGKRDEARKLLEKNLGDRTTPQSVSERTLLMLSLLTDQEAAAATPPAASAPAPAPAVPATEAPPKAAAPPAKGEKSKN